jgi:hypothetical protein
MRFDCYGFLKKFPSIVVDGVARDTDPEDITNSRFVDDLDRQRQDCPVWSLEVQTSCAQK